MQLLTFTLNSIDFGIPVKTVEAIETQRNVIPVPNSPAHVQGIMNLHGEIIAVYSLASRFGYGNLPVGNIVVAGINGMKIGLEVEQVKSILEVEDKNVIPMPEIMNATQNCFNDVASSQQELIVLFDVGKLLSQEEYQGISKMVDDNSKNNKLNILRRCKGEGSNV